jgi:hypothetical protein
LAVSASIAAGLAFGLLGVALGRDDVPTQIVGGAIVASCVVLIARGVVRRDLSGVTMVDDW